jgi:hypothetical protein
MHRKMSVPATWAPSESYPRLGLNRSRRPLCPKVSQSLRSRSGVPVVALLWVSCATATGPTTTVERDVVSEKWISSRAPGDVVVTSSKWRTSEQMDVTVARQILCTKARATRVAYRRHKVFESHGVGEELAGGTLVGAIGGACLASAPHLSDESSTDSSGRQDVSDRELAFVCGITGVVVGVAMLGHAAYIALKGRETLGRPTYREEIEAPTAAFVCGTAPTRRGTVFALVDGERFEVGPVKGPTFTVHPETVADHVCNDEAVLAKGTKVTFAYRDDNHEGLTPAEVNLGVYDPAPCIRRTVARRELAAAGVEIANGSAKDLASASKRIARARRIASALSPDDSAAQALQKGSDQESERLTSVSRKVLPGELKATLELIASGRPWKEKAMETLSLLEDREESAATWKALYGAISRQLARKDDAPDQLLAVVREDRLTLRCFDHSDWVGCPRWLPDELLSATFQPVLAGAVAAVTSKQKSLQRDLAKFAKSTTLAALGALNTDLTKTKSDELCSGELGRFEPLHLQCGKLKRLESEGVMAIEERQERIDELARAEKEAAHKKEQRDVATAWSRHIAACQRLYQGGSSLEAAESRGLCGRECEAVRAKMAQELQRLRNFEPAALLDDQEQMARLSDSCHKAGCEVCP